MGIAVCNVPDYGTREVADHAIALMLTLAKSIAYHDEQLRADLRANWRPAHNPYGRRLSVCTYGVVGMGRIGTAAARRAKAFDMDVVFYDPYQPNGYELAIGVRRADLLAELMGQCDFVSIHAPLTAETRNMMGATAFAAAKRGMILINTARGPIVDIDALYDALKDGTILAAGLDVLPEEPANPQSRLIAAWQKNEDWIRNRLIVTPHSAFYTPESMRIIAPSPRARRRDSCATGGWRIASTSNSSSHAPEAAGHERQGRRSHRRIRCVRRGGRLEPRRNEDANPVPGTGRLDEAVGIPVERTRLRSAAVQRLRDQPEHSAADERLSRQRRQFADQGAELQRGRRLHGDVHRALSAAASLGLSGSHRWTAWPMTGRWITRRWNRSLPKTIA